MFLNNFICQLDSAINKLLSITLDMEIIQNWGIGYLFSLHKRDMASKQTMCIN